VNGVYRWNPVSQLTAELANEDLEREIRIEFFKSQKSGKHTNLGVICFNLAQLRENTLTYSLTDRRGKKTSQSASFENLRFNKRHTFLEYVFGGCEIELSIAIDFTLSNGYPRDRDSLHYLDMNKNEYLKAIQSCGSIL
jgi:hypothetical protein